MDIASFIMAAISLLIAVVSFILSLRGQRLQNKVNEIELKIKNYELEEKEKENQKISCVEARIIKVGKNNYRIKVWNSGNCVAKNINVILHDKEGIIFNDRGKLPFEILEPNKSFELPFSVFDVAPFKIFITTEWEEESGEKHNKKQLCDR